MEIRLKLNYSLPLQRVIFTFWVIWVFWFFTSYSRIALSILKNIKIEVGMLGKIGDLLKCGDICYNGSNPGGGMIFLNNHV